MAERQRSTVVPYLLYENAEAALLWLSDVFDFAETLRVQDGERVSHAEMRAGSGQIYLGEPGGDFRSPASGGYPGAIVCVEIDDVDAHYAKSRAAGAAVVEEPADQPYGFRRYSVTDPEGHSWYFMQHLRDVAPEEYGGKVAG